MEPYRTVTFHVQDADSSNAIEGANVAITQDGSDTISGTTDADGNVVFTLADGTYQYSVSADGYVAVNDVEFSIAGDTTITVQLVPYRTVTFHVQDADSGDSIPSATITVKQGTTTVLNGTTDNNGDFVGSLADGDYTYDASASGYDAVTGVEFTINKDTTIIIALTVTGVDLPEGVALYPNPTDGVLILKGAQGMKVEVIDMSGKVVYTTKATTNDVHINLTAYQSGTYILKVYADRIYKAKIIKK